MSDAARHIRPGAILRLDIIGVLRDSIVDAIDSLNEFFVHFQPKKLGFLIIGLRLQSVGYNLLPKMPRTRCQLTDTRISGKTDSLVDQTGR